MEPSDRHLPPALADRFTRPFARFLKIESATGVLLFAATCGALLLASSPASEAVDAFWSTHVGIRFGEAEYGRSLRHWINDGLMTLFFFVVALELKRQLVHGELRRLRLAAFSLAGALGGMLVPAVVYLSILHGEPGARGFGIVMTTDTAFVVGALALLGARVPAGLRLFLLSLAIFDDVGAILVVAIWYGHALSGPALAIALALLAAAFVAARVGIRSLAVYWLLGIGVWLALDASGIHATLAGVVLGLMTPAREWVSDERLHTILGRVLSYPKGAHWSGDTPDRADLRRAGTAAKEALSPVERLELALHPWTGFVVMPLFALANAGVRIVWSELGDPVTIAVVAGLAIGKPIGVITMSWLALRLGIAARPSGLPWPVIVAGSLLTGIGFTMSLFIAGLAFEGEALVAAKVGIFGASIVAGAAGLVALATLTSAKKRVAEGGEEVPIPTS